MLHECDDLIVSCSDAGAVEDVAVPSREHTSLGFQFVA